MSTADVPSHAIRMQPADAMYYWFADKIDTNQFMAYAFAGCPVSTDDAVAAVLERARRLPDLGLRVRDDPLGLRFPRWVLGDVHGDQCVVHRLEDATWAGFLNRMASLVTRDLDPRIHAWRLHVFTPVSGVPGSPDAATIVVTQMPHALGDGRRCAALAGWLFGRDEAPSAVTPPPSAGPFRRVATAFREKRALDRDTATGRVSPARPDVPALSTNGRPSDERVLRTLIRPVGTLPGPTPTIGALVAVSDALGGYLTARGEDPAQLTAAVPMAKSTAAHAFNHVANAIVGLYPGESRVARIPLIAADLINSRRRNEHPAVAARERVFAAVPAGVRRWIISRADFSTVPAMVPGNTVVSSVDRGPADLHFGGCPVLFTAGYPLLLPICNLAHGVHILGDTVAVSVHTTPATDIDEYVDRLAAALDR